MESPQALELPRAAVEAAKAGLDYRLDAKGNWAVVRKRSQPLLRVGKVAANDPDFVALCRAFKLNPEKRSFDLTTDKLDPFLVGAPEKGLDVLDMETRSLLQVLFFVSHGVDVPPPHAARGYRATDRGAGRHAIRLAIRSSRDCSG